MSGQDPILIGGLSYSGKTQVRMVLGAHPAISMTRRTYLWDRFYGRFGDLRIPENLDRCLSTMLESERVRRLQPEPHLIRREFLDGPATYARLFGLLHQHHAERIGRQRWGEQLGHVERFADPIFESFPSARMIHMIRDPRARHAARAEGTPPRHGTVGWETGMWMHSAELASRNLRQYPDRYRVVRYETLAARPEETLRDLCSFIEEEYAPSMDAVRVGLRFDDMDEDPTRDQGRANGSPAAMFVDTYANRELKVFGYDVKAEGQRQRASLSFHLVDKPLNRATMTAWRLFGPRRLRWKARR
jgi:hypothetical protein